MISGLLGLLNTLIYARYRARISWLRITIRLIRRSAAYQALEPDSLMKNEFSTACDLSAATLCVTTEGMIFIEFLFLIAFSVKISSYTGCPKLLGKIRRENGIYNKFNLC